MPIEQASQTGQTLNMKVGPRAIYRIWLDFQVRPLIYKSISTVKADAALASFAASGEGMVWAVLDSGIDADHPHFKLHENLKVNAPLVHRDFTKLDDDNPQDALQDAYGHGTHVAGIIAGEMRVTKDGNPEQPRRRSAPLRVCGMRTAMSLMLRCRCQRFPGWRPSASS